MNVLTEIWCMKLITMQKPLRTTDDDERIYIRNGVRGGRALCQVYNQWNRRIHKREENKTNNKSEKITKTNRIVNRNAGNSTKIKKREE